ncbi:MAG TPA: hypothetical protein VLD35_03785 [Caldimonas sp.]|nr:hypothetical protein [Caldimonas sp.]
MRRLMISILAVLAIAVGLLLAWYVERGAASALRTPRSYGYRADWSWITFFLPTLLLIAASLVAGWRAMRWVLTAPANAGRTPGVPRMRGLVMLLAAAPPTGVPLAAALESVRVWHDTSIGMWQLLVYPCLIVGLLLTMGGFRSAASAFPAMPKPAA